MNIRKMIHELVRQEKPLSPDEFWAAGGCLTFPGKVAKAITGIDPTEAGRAEFSTEAGARRVMVKNNCTSMADVALLAYPEIPVAQARAGDWAVVRNADGSEGLGVVMGSQIAVQTVKGMGIVPRLRASSAYRVA